MKFSELDAASWPGLQMYFDTCLLPVTGLDGREEPWEAADKAAAAGAWLSPVEHAYKGRTVTLPAYHYYDGEAADADKLRVVVGRLREQGFRFVVLVCGQPGLLPDDAGADLTLAPAQPGEHPDEAAVRQAIAALWRGKPEGAGTGEGA